MYLVNKNKRVDKFGKNFNYTMLATCLTLGDKVVSTVELTKKMSLSTSEYKDLVNEALLRFKYH